MSISLPKPVAGYFAADRGDHEALALCFAEDAVVTDERRTHSGRDAIRRWKIEVSAKYNYVSEPIAAVRDGDRTIVTSRVTGDFPGSPIELRYAFTVAGDHIARLEIAP